MGVTEAFDAVVSAEGWVAYDRPAPVAEQCRWLAEADLVDVDCFFKQWRLPSSAAGANSGYRRDDWRSYRWVVCTA